MLTKLAAGAEPGNLEALSHQVNEKVRAQCPKVKWLVNYAILGPCDYLDIFEAANEQEAGMVAMIVRSVGHATTETWGALPWGDFIGKMKDISR